MSKLEIKYRPGHYNLINLGRIMGTTQDLFSGPEDFPVHFYVEGRTGTGKTVWLSSFCQQMACHDIAGFLALDMMGGSFGDPLIALPGQINKLFTIKARTPYSGLNSKIRLARDQFLHRWDIVDFRKRDINGYYYNLLERVNGMSASECASLAVRVFSNSMGANRDEQLQRGLNLKAAWTLISEINGTIADTVDLLFMNEEQIRRYLEYRDNQQRQNRHHLEYPLPNTDFVRQFMHEFFAATKDRERREFIRSCMTALAVLQDDPLLARFLAAPRGNLRFDKVVNERRFVVVILPQHMDSQVRKVIGTMMVEGVTEACARRSKQEAKLNLFATVVDEFYLVFNSHWSEKISNVRNAGQVIVASHQSDFQPPLQSLDGQGLLSSFRENSHTHIYFSLGLKSAISAVPIIFQPDGKLLKHMVTDRSESVTHSWGKAKANSISETISDAKATGTSKAISFAEGLSASVTENRGVTIVEMEGLTISHSDSENWSQAVSEGSGRTITRTQNETYIEGTGSGTVDSQSSSESSMEGHSHGTGTNQGDTSTTFFSLSNGDGHFHGV